MRKLSSVFYMWVAFAFGVIAVLAMFLPTMTKDGGDICRATSFFWNFADEKGAWPAFAGYMLILVGAIASAVIALPFVQPSVKVEKIVLISSIVAIAVGTIAVGLLQVEYSLFNGNRVGFELSNLTYLVGWYFTVVSGVIAVAADVIALKLDW